MAKLIGIEQIVGDGKELYCYKSHNDKTLTVNNVPKGYDVYCAGEEEHSSRSFVIIGKRTAQGSFDQESFRLYSGIGNTLKESEVHRVQSDAKFGIKLIYSSYGKNSPMESLNVPTNKSLTMISRCEGDSRLYDRLF